MFGDSEDVDATENEYTDQFKKEGIKSQVIGSGMKEVRADFEGRGEYKEIEIDPSAPVVDLSSLPDILLPDIPE